MVTYSARAVLLVKACLAEAKDFPDRFAQFDTEENFEALEGGEIRLIPYLYRRLEREGITTSPRFGRYRGVYAKFWYSDVMASQDRQPLDALLSDIPYLVLKGSALRSLIYAPDFVSRPIDDVDVLVHPTDRFRAYRRLVAAGFRPNHPYPAQRVLDLKLSLGTVRDGQSVDLHWGLYPTRLANTLFSELLSRRLVHEIDGREQSTLSLEDHFLHSLLHGSVPNEVSPVRWVLDAALLMKHPRFSWADTITIAHRWGWGVEAAKGLVTLRDFFGVDIPDRYLLAMREGPSLAGINFYQKIRAMSATPIRAILSLTVANSMNLQQLAPPQSATRFRWVGRAIMRWLRSRQLDSA